MDTVTPQNKDEMNPPYTIKNTDDIVRLAEVLEEGMVKEESTDLLKSQGYKICEKLTIKNIEDVENKFQKNGFQSFSKIEFKNILEDLAADIVFPNDEEFTIMFKKMDCNGDDKVDWDEFISYLMIEFQEIDTFGDPTTKQKVELPISTPIRVIKSYHRHPIVRITYCPAVSNDRKMNYHNGKYLTASKDGLINYWSLGMVKERSVVSTCPELKMISTRLTDIVCMPDISIICTSSTERDLRFYDTTAKKFELRVMITSLVNAVCCMDYCFSTDIQEDSKLLLGDVGGSILIFFFNTHARGPFKQLPGVDIIHYRFDAVMKGNFQGLRVISFINLHHDWVSQIAYYPALKSFLSCCKTPDVSMALGDIGQQRPPYKFNVPVSGISCFDFSESLHVIVTGGTDWLIRVWSPFVPTKPNTTLKGHHSAICAIVIQEDTNMFYSICKARIIKVWRMTTFDCIQTYTSLSNCMKTPHNTSLRLFYNPETHTIMIASSKIALIVADKIINQNYTDGYTHSKAVIKALYNPLFKCLVTIGMDSCIMNWDPYSGIRTRLIKKAHTQMLYGEEQEIEITAGTFDPSYSFLLTGARDGSLKIWNFNNGTCIRNMSIEKECRVTNVMWIPNRILAVGWNRHICEFADGSNTGNAKYWETRHVEDILASDLKPPQVLVTSSYAGELVFWRLETGQPYKKYSVSDPEKKHKLVFGKTFKSEVSFDSHRSAESKSSKVIPIPSYAVTPVMNRMKPAVSTTASLSSSTLPAPKERSSTSENFIEEDLPIHSTLFLQTRPMEPDWGSLLVSVESGRIQMWSHHKSGGLIDQFIAHNSLGNYVIVMGTDSKNTYLFTGDTSGFIGVWLMTNFGVPAVQHIKIDIDKLKNKFCYFGKFNSVQSTQDYPILLSSYQAHLMTVTHLEYLDSMEILISCSVDKSVRFWSLGGQYLGTLGGLQRWPNFVPDELVDNVLRNTERRIPPDIERIASKTTLQVIGFSEDQVITSSQHEKDIEKFLSEKRFLYTVYGKSCSDPILGNYYKLPSRGLRRIHQPKIDVNTGPRIQVFAHMFTHELNTIKDCILPPAGVKKGRSNLLVSESSNLVSNQLSKMRYTT